MYARVVPSIRAIPGVEEFDYAIPSNAHLQCGDVMQVPFRSRRVPGIVVAISETSSHADRAILLDDPLVFLRLTPATVALLRETATRCFSSLPSVFHSWIRGVPKRQSEIQDVTPLARQLSFTRSESHVLADRWFDPNGLIPEAKKSSGRVLILTPWRHRVEKLATLLSGSALHSGLSIGAGWKSIRSFASSSSGILVATRIGAWLASVADTVLIDEPENDDHKQDELAPRYDARWIVRKSAELRPELRVCTFGVTPRLEEHGMAPPINVHLSLEVWRRRSGSAIETLSPQSVQDIETALEHDREIFILHPVRGVRSRVSCRDCGWRAICSACGWNLSLGVAHAFCKRCGRRADLPSACPSCGGTDFSRGLPGAERLSEQCAAYFKTDRVRVGDIMGMDSDERRSTCLPTGTTSDARSLILITDLSLLSGATEDIRRRERLIIAWRRIAATAASSGAELRVQGPEELLAECRAWLTSDGLARAWKKEMDDRHLFGFPPATRLVKLLVDGDSSIAEVVRSDVQQGIPSEWNVRGPYPVAYRSITRTSRHVLQLIAPRETSDQKLTSVLAPFTSRAYIDIDPISFFS